METYLPIKLKHYLTENDIWLYTISAMRLAQEADSGRRINMVMEIASSKLADIIPFDEMIPLPEEEVLKGYGHKSMTIVEKDIQAIDQTIELFHEVVIPEDWETLEIPEKTNERNKGYVQEVPEPVNAQKGNYLSVGIPVANGVITGGIPLGTTSAEKRGTVLEVPEWIDDHCTMCNEYVFVCPHAAIHPFLADEEEVEEAPEGFIVRGMRGADDVRYRVQVSVEDCTGCDPCVKACPTKGKALVIRPYGEQEGQITDWAFATTLGQKENPIKGENTVLSI